MYARADALGPPTRRTCAPWPSALRERLAREGLRSTSAPAPQRPPAGRASTRAADGRRRSSCCSEAGRRASPCVSGSGPTRVRPVRATPARQRRPRASGSAAELGRRGDRRAPATLRERLSRAVIENLIKDLAQASGQWAYLLVAFMAMAETAAFLGFIAPGEFTIIFGGVLAGEGTLSIAAPDRDRVGLVRDRRLDRVHARPPARARLRAQARAAGAAHRGAPQARSRTSSSATAARRSSSAAGSASCGR